MVFCAFQERQKYFLSVMGSDDNTLTAEFGDTVQTSWLLSLRKVSALPACNFSSHWSGIHCIEGSCHLLLPMRI